MRHMIRLLLITLLFSFISPVWADNGISVPILTYHNVDPVQTGSTTISNEKFEAQLKWLKDNGYTVIPLLDLVSYLQGKTTSLPAKSVVITADDGRASVYKHMYPIIKKYNVPVTLFVYPSAISNASYAMTWDQLKELQKTGLFNIQSHTYWHPNFEKEKSRLTAEEYQKFVDIQMSKSKKVLEDKLGIHVTLLAWPFGIFNDGLEAQASKAGYDMAFTIQPRPANKSDKPMAEPRYIIAQGQSLQTFAGIAQGHPGQQMRE